MIDHTKLPPHDPLERTAQRRAKAKMGWYIHASVYVVVNLLLAFFSSRSNYAWAIFPAMGWGLGLLIHGLAVWFAMPGGGLYNQLLERERAAVKCQPPK